MGSSGGLQRTTYDVSAMTLAAHEDKTYRGAYIAPPSMPWVWGTGLENPSAAYHLVWSRDLYQIATALLADGDRAGAERALTYLFERQQKADGSFPQNPTVDGTQKWSNTQLDEVALPIVLAWQLGRNDGTTYRSHIKPAAEYVVANGPQTPQERWENQCGYSPATIASEIAGLVCAADIARQRRRGRRTQVPVGAGGAALDRGLQIHGTVSVGRAVPNPTVRPSRAADCRPRRWRGAR
ncbi:MAG: glycoside hydrolase family 15 protein [Chloroflexota bacterium]|nr:glycoside hydrolase family 15 protein [Chloroflexota bacterium]